MHLKDLATYIVNLTTNNVVNLITSDIVNLITNNIVIVDEISLTLNIIHFFKYRLIN